MEVINTTGRRKTAVARVYLKQGTGVITINNRDYKSYFAQPHIQIKITEALKEVSVEAIYDVKVNVAGGGINGQADAVRLGIARALVELNEEFRAPLKVKKLLTRDPRSVERKKYGQPKARKRFQFSKR